MTSRAAQARAGVRAYSIAARAHTFPRLARGSNIGSNTGISTPMIHLSANYSD